MVMSLGDFYFVGLVTVFSCLQMIIVGVKVGKSRKQYGVPAPKTTGNETWERMFRAQQNMVEWFPVFITLLWLGAIFGNPVIPAVLGLIYLFGRDQYFKAYVSNPEKRGIPFRILFAPLVLLVFYNLFNIGKGLYLKYT